MNQEKLAQFVERAWNDEAVPLLVEYIKIPNKSPEFDKDWEKHGHMERAVELLSGWAKQTARRTVQGELESALQTVMRLPYPVELTVAGRTDAGVHARGQVAHLDLAQDVWDAHRDVLMRRLAGRLPHDVRVWKVAEAPSGFNARFSAMRPRAM